MRGEVNFSVVISLQDWRLVKMVIPSILGPILWEEETCTDNIGKY